MEGDRSSHTATTTQLHHRPEATSLHGISTQFNFTAQTFISILTRNLCLSLDQNRLYGATPGDSCLDLVQFVTQLICHQLRANRLQIWQQTGLIKHVSTAVR